jgi:hypothetical protein
MSILIELLLELFGGGIGPQSDRGLVATLGAASVALALATVWLSPLLLILSGRRRGVFG